MFNGQAEFPKGPKGPNWKEEPGVKRNGKNPEKSVTYPIPLQKSAKSNRK